MEEKDIRWVQRFSNYRKALLQLGKAVAIVSAQKSRGDADKLMEEGLIQRYEYTHELAWKVMKDYAEYQGLTDIVGSRDAIRQTLQAGLISDERWMDSIRDRNLTSHNYDDDTAVAIVTNIINVYYPLFVDYEKVMLKRLETMAE
ncbi:MAG: nucleotidyltransferase substrate binding protein [Salinivirgaceae bacterium]|nr:nucleotidyltransferase substrate binding protein [Salinivirgaceae bacterium]